MGCREGESCPNKHRNERAEKEIADLRTKLAATERKAERLRKVALYFMRQGADGPWGWLRKSDLDAPKEGT